MTLCKLRPCPFCGHDAGDCQVLLPVVEAAILARLCWFTVSFSASALIKSQQAISKPEYIASIGAATSPKRKHLQKASVLHCGYALAIGERAEIVLPPK